MRFKLLKWSILWVCLYVGWGCGGKKIPLDKDQFTALIIDMHRIDGTLAVEKGISRNQDLKNYTYYNDLFRKYDIDRADFDSCMYYYSAQTKLFSEIYDVVIDSLNKQLTGIDKILNELKSRDSVNYFPLADTIQLDSVFTVRIDSIVPGLYKFNTKLRFDSVERNTQRLIISYFLSPDAKDTLRIRDIYVFPDTLVRTYNWSQYADSVYSHLIISYLAPLNKSQKEAFPRNPKHERSQEKKVNLKDFGGKAWNNQLFRPYISKNTEERMKQGLRRK